MLSLAVSEITLTSSPSSSNGYFCPEPVQFTCVGTEINGLRWRVNSTNQVAYNLIDDGEQNIHLTLDPPLPNAMVTIFNATRIRDNTINMFSTLSFVYVSDFRESQLLFF